MRKFFGMLVLALMVLFAFAQDEMPATVVDVAVNNDGFSTLVTALTEAGLVETLSGEGPYTVFAPTDDAFAALPEGTLDGLLADPEALSSVLTYHVVAGNVLAADLVGMADENGVVSVETLNGATVEVMVGEDGTVTLNDSATVTMTDLEAGNGVVHVIDSVLLPPEDM